MKALTVSQPWAWAIIHGGKNIENRTTNWSYRGPLAIHAGRRWSVRGEHSDPIPCSGRLGLWTPPADVRAELSRQTR